MVEKDNTVEDFSSSSCWIISLNLMSPLKAVTDLVTSCQKMLRGGLSTVPHINNSPKHGILFHPSSINNKNREGESHRSNRREGRNIIFSCSKPATALSMISNSTISCRKGSFLFTHFLLGRGFHVRNETHSNHSPFSPFGKKTGEF